MEEESKVSSEYKEVLDLIHFKTLFDNLNQAIVAFQDSPTPLARKIVYIYIYILLIYIEHHSICSRQQTI